MKPEATTPLKRAGQDVAKLSQSGGQGPDVESVARMSEQLSAKEDERQHRSSLLGVRLEVSHPSTIASGLTG